MRVLHVIPSVSERSGGPASAIIPMCRALREHGVDVLLVTTDAGLQNGTSERGLAPSVCDYKGVPAIFFPSQFGESFKYSRPLADWLRANIREFDLAHVHAVFNHSSVATAQVCRRAGVPYVVRPLGTLDPWSMAQKPLRKRIFWHVSGNTMLRRAGAVHYTSEAEKLSAEGLFGLDHGRVIALGVKANSSCRCSYETLPRNAAALGDGPYVLALSRLHPKKGLDVLLDAFLLLTRDANFAHWRLVIAGDGPVDYVTTLKRKAEASVQRDRILFTGWLNEESKEAVLGNASLLVLPSYQENFGLAAMEALAYSVPVLISPHVDLAAEIVSADAGWIAAVETGALATRLAEALADESELKRRGRAGKELSLQYSWEDTAERLVGLYQAVLKRS